MPKGFRLAQLLGSSHFSLVTASPFDVPWRGKRFLRSGDRAGTRGCGTTDLPWLTVGVACGAPHSRSDLAPLSAESWVMPGSAAETRADPCRPSGAATLPAQVP